MLGRVVGFLVDAHAQRHVDAVGRRADHDLARAGAQMQRRLVARGEQAGRFDHDVDLEFLPRQLGRIALREHAEGVAVEHDLIALGLDLMLERAVHRVMLEQMREGLGVGDVVDRDDLDLFLVQHRPKSHPADSAETVDPDPDRHGAILPEMSLSRDESRSVNC